ncbi:hypothetical protein [Hyphomonas sp.]|uniref:hypothetical protein n=1 Tax=Hyphomonas sp. TaxID=87 RepID=UPI0025C5B904|nr:hypothetical protein [Hyphomonas sp.]|tara:strand:- start:2059 stop:3351 length:1293 start_codon:yes stop_codon:yes gene_type:complete
MVAFLPALGALGTSALRFGPRLLQTGRGLLQRGGGIPQSSRQFLDPDFLRTAFLESAKRRPVRTAIGGGAIGNLLFPPDFSGGSGTQTPGTGVPINPGPITSETTTQDTIQTPDISTSDDDDDRGSFLANAQNLFGDTNRLQNIITGVGLLEGLSPEEAVKVGASIKGIPRGPVDTEVYDTRLKRVVYTGNSSDATVTNFSNDTSGRYLIQDRGKDAERYFEREQKREEGKIKVSEKAIEEFAKNIDDMTEVNALVDQVLELIESGELDTGVTKPFTTLGKRLTGGIFGDVTNEELLNALNTKLAVLQRVPGSGQTSDIEFEAYRAATVGLGRTEDYNKQTLRRVQVASRMIESKLAYITDQVYNEGATYADALKEFSDQFSKENYEFIARVMGVDGVITDVTTQKIEPGKEYYILDKNSDKYQSIELVR